MTAPALPATGEDTRRKVVVTRRLFPEVIAALRQRFEVDAASGDEGFGSREALLDRARDAEGLLVTISEKIEDAVLDACPRLRVIANVGVGYNNIDVAACTRRSIVVTNTPGVLDDTTADLAFGLMLAAARRVVELDACVRRGDWRTAFNVDQFLGVDVHHRTVGIVGLGRIGQLVARRARGFDMRVLYNNRNRLAAPTEDALGVRHVDLDELLATSDFVVLLVPYSAATHHLIGGRELALMKPTAVLVNLARGGIIDEQALAAGLAGRRIAAAALDVFEGEPNVRPVLLDLANVVLTPHIGSATHATRRDMAELAALNLAAVLESRRPPNPVNPEVLVGNRR